MSSYIIHLANKLLQNVENNFSRPIVNLSIAGVSLGLVIMLLAIMITSGYKNVIEQKVVGMGAHVKISNYDLNYSFEPIPFDKNVSFISELEKNPEIAKLQYFSTKVGVVKTDNQVEGIVLKGIDTSFSCNNFITNLVEGSMIDVAQQKVSNEIIISTTLSKKLQLKLGDKVRTYFIQDPPRQRSFTIVGIYETGMPMYDEKYALVDLRQVQKLNGWDSNMVGGIEILIHDFNNLDAVGASINESIGYDLKAETIKQIYPEIFQWLALFDTNVIVLLVITIIVCIITMMSTFFIIILEQTPTIGVLKSLGMKTKSLVKTFLFIAGKIILKGMVVGNVIAIGLGIIQQYFHIVKLDMATYYIDYIPIQFNVLLMIMINVGVLLVCLSVLLIPAVIVANRISPVKAIRFD